MKCQKCELSSDLKSAREFSYKITMELVKANKKIDKLTELLEDIRKEARWE